MTAWIVKNSQMIFFLGQIAYWFFMVLFVGYAVAQYKRWVNFQLGTGHSGNLKNTAENDGPTSKVSVEEFVE